MRLAMAAAILIVLVLPARQAPAQGSGTEVDLALVLAVDVSLSMDPEEQWAQRDGYVAAFRSAAVQTAIRQGLIGRVAVSYVEWAGVGSQYVVVPWTVIGTAAEAEEFADQLTRARPRRAIWTSISAALDFSVGLLRASGFEATRRVIDVSGDGPNNQGREVTQARDDAMAAGIVINGLPLMISAPTGPYDIPDLDLYYRDCVIGGPGAFMVPVREVAEFATAIRTKIVREVADAFISASPIVPVQGFSRARCAETGRRGGDLIPDVPLPLAGHDDAQQGVSRVLKVGAPNTLRTLRTHGRARARGSHNWASVSRSNSSISSSVKATAEHCWKCTGIGMA